MNKNCIYLLFLATPTISFPMDWIASTLGSVSSSSGSPISQANLPIPPEPTLAISNQNNNNNTNQELTNQHQIMRRLRNDLLENMIDKGEISAEQMQQAATTFQIDLKKYDHYLKGPDLWALQEHVFELENYVEKDMTIHRPTLQKIEATIDQYLDIPRHQQILTHSFYLSPDNVVYPFSHYYINFCTATHAYLNALTKKVDESAQTVNLLETCNILQEYFKKLNERQHPNAFLTGNSKLATFAAICLQKNREWFEQKQGIYSYEKQAVSEILNKWAVLAPQHVGIEAAWGQSIL